MLEGGHRQVSAEIYGLIVCSSVLATVTADDEVVTMAVIVLVTLAVYWAAETHAHVLAGYATSRRAPSRGEITRVAREGAPLIATSYIPLVVLIGAGLLGVAVEQAALLALITATGMLFAIGYMTGRRAGATGRKLVVSTLVPGFLGIILIILKAALH